MYDIILCDLRQVQLTPLLIHIIYKHGLGGALLVLFLSLQLISMSSSTAHLHHIITYTYR